MGREHDVRITGLTVARRTLEDIYLQLTGTDPERLQDDWRARIGASMSTSSAEPRKPGPRLADLRLVAWQVRYEQLSFWLNPIGAIFTVGVSLLFLVMLSASAGSSRVSYLDNVKLVQYYVPGFIAYGVMSASLN